MNGALDPLGQAPAQVNELLLEVEFQQPACRLWEGRFPGAMPEGPGDFYILSFTMCFTQHVTPGVLISQDNCRQAPLKLDLLL